MRERFPEAGETRCVMVYGATREEAIARVQALALHVIADRLEHGEAAPTAAVTFRPAA